MPKTSTVEPHLRMTEARQAVAVAEARLIGSAKRRTAQKGRERVPVRTGRLRGSIGVTDEGVVASEDYAWPVQQDTGYLTTAAQETLAELGELAQEARL